MVLNLQLQDLIEIENLLICIFRQLDSEASRKHLLSITGIEQDFLDKLRYNLNVKEFTMALMDEFITKHTITSQTPEDHPLIRFLNYITRIDQGRFNLDLEELELCRKILAIARNKIENLDRNNSQQEQTSEIQDLLEQQINNQQTNMIGSEEVTKIDNHIIVNFDCLYSNLRSWDQTSSSRIRFT